ncbi:MAG TPA: hypothetical protein VLA14_15675 [Polyangia bacterium]|nr:hypothetical protein [Polyangia bacterium]
MRAGARRCAILATLSASVIAGGARAASDHDAPDRDASPITLDWEAPAGCPSSDEVSRELAHVVRAPAGKTLPHLAVVARVEARGARWLLHLRTVRDGVEGERDLEAESCASLARAATLVVALALGVGGDEVDVAPPPPPPEEPRPRPSPRPRVVEAPPAPPPIAPAPPLAPTPSPAPARPAPVAIVVAVPPPPSPRLAWILAVDARATRGPLPGTSFGAGFGLDGGRRRFFASLRFETWLPADEATAAVGVRARFTGVGAALAGCAVAARAGRFTLAGCAGVRAAALHGASSGALADGGATAPWYAAVPALRTRARLLRAVFVDVGVELAASLNQPRFAIGNLGDIHTVPRLVPAAMLGLAVDL